MKKRIGGVLLTRGCCFIIALALVSFWSATWALAQSYPTRPIKFILHVPPGGSIDTMARMLAESLNKKWGQPVVVENRAGASGTIGMNAVVQAPPDGYTLLFGTGATLVINRIMFPAIAKLEPVSRLATNPLMLVVNAKQVSAKTLPELVEYAKANPGQLNYASTGDDGMSNLSAVMFQSKAGIKLTKVTYRGMAPAVLDVVAGHAQLIFVDMSTVLPHIEAGTLRVLGVASQHRHPLLLDVPALIEMFPDFTAETWFAMAAPPGTPGEIVNKVADAAREAIGTPPFPEAMKKMGGIEAIGSTPVEMTVFLKQEEARWRDVIRSIGLSAN